jgi:acetyl/propionyl-CoA carboxylase alpha subunit
VHLFERECSIQRRHQKVIEESPSTAVTPALRERMGAAAVAVARAAGYRNAGTIEFLVEGTGDTARFYFLEMNTRLQVEHPVTEAVTGIDLVRAQIAIAAGDPLPWRQADLSQRGHAIELRIYAEDPARHDLPQAGPVLLYREPAMPGIRIDSGIVEGGEVSVHYDPLMAKLIAHAETRDMARQRARAALRSFPILGVRTNTGLLQALLDHPRFVAGDLDTQMLEAEGDVLRAALATDASAEITAVAAAAAQAPAAARGTADGDARAQDPWTTLRNARV